jgi:hypothetical protein
MPERMDAAVPADAKNAPTGTWKTAQNAVSHSVHTHYSLVSGEEERRASETSVTRLTHGIPDTPHQLVKILASIVLTTKQRLVREAEQRKTQRTKAKPTSDL